VGPVSDEDLDRLNVWIVSDEGRLIQETAIALLQDEQQHPDNETLLIYCLVAMMLDTDPPAEAALKIRALTENRFAQSPRRNKANRRRSAIAAPVLATALVINYHWSVLA
jgi:hypothetical protein